MMKLLATLMAVVGLVAFARADEEYYSASGPQYYQQPQYTSSYSNYHQQPQYSGHSFLDGIFGANRRQGGLFGAGAVPVVILVGLGVAAAVLFVAAGLASTSSGRGLDKDEWEVDHSVWMDQLHKDFEDSWSTQ